MAEKTPKAEVQEEKNSERAIYELGYHIVSTIKDEQLPREVSSIKGEVEKFGGAFISEEFPAHVTLAYTMVRSAGGKREKFASAYFGWVKFEMDVEQVSSLQESLKENDNVLRFLLFRTVREDTRAPKRVMAPPPKPPEPIRPKFTEVPKKKKESDEQVSDADLDRTIEQLVVE